MRGVHDSGLVTKYATTTAQKVAVMNSIISEQRKILAQEVDADLTAVPQIFIPYKEVLDLYNAGVKVPDDVTLVWPDDNHHHMRQMPTAAEQARSGGNGLYYHISYWGDPKSYLRFSGPIKKGAVLTIDPDSNTATIDGKALEVTVPGGNHYQVFFRPASMATPAAP